MIDITRNQNNCDHVFSFVSQDGVHIFKCESCGAEHQFTGDSNAETHEAYRLYSTFINMAQNGFKSKVDVFIILSV